LSFSDWAAAGFRSVMAIFIASDSLPGALKGYVECAWIMLARVHFGEMPFG
jgi:hypothetical protein